MDTRRQVAWMLLLCAAALHATPVPMAALARHIEYRNVEISPDGQYLATTTLDHKQTVLALIHLADKKQSIVRPRDKNDVLDFWWASSNRVVYTVGMHQGGYDIPVSLGELFAVDADGANPKMIYGYRMANHAWHERGSAELVATIADDPDHVLVEVNLWDEDNQPPVVYRMDVHTGERTKVAAAPMLGATLVADHHGRVRFAYGEDLAGNLQVYRNPLDGTGWQLLPDAGAGRAYPWAFNADDSVAYFACPQTSAGFGVCRWNPATHGLEPVWHNDRVEADALLHGLARDSIVGVGFMDGRAGAALFDSQSADAQALTLLMKQFPGEKVSFVSGTRDGRLSVVLVEADADPGTFYLYDHQARKLTQLLSRASWIDPEQMASKQPFEFAARDGVRLQGYVSLPPAAPEPKDLPMVVFVHGGPFGERDRWDYDPDVQALATHGYAVLQVNFRGSGGYGYAFERSGWREWGLKMQDDLTDATRWAIAQHIADPHRICIFGASYGGYAALEGAMKQPDLYRCAIGYAGVYDLPMMFQRGDIAETAKGKAALRRIMGDDQAALALHSPINQLDALKAKVMLVVGGKDERVPPIQGTRLRKALEKRDVAVEWLYKPDEMHGFYGEANNAELYDRLARFLDANTGPASTGASATSASAVAAQPH